MKFKSILCLTAVCLLMFFSSAQSQTALCVTPPVPGEWDLPDLATQDIPIILDTGDVGDAFTTAYTVRSTEFRLIHTYSGDLGGSLISPNGTNVQLWQLGDGSIAPSIGPGSNCGEGGYDITFSDTGGGAPLTIANEDTYCVGNTDYTLASGAGGTADPFVFNVVNPGNPAIQGIATPIEPLSDFNGDDINGTWTARITDGYAQDLGAITEVCLDVTFAGVDHEFFVSTDASCNDQLETNTFAFGDTFYVCQNVVNKGTETFQVEFLTDTTTDVGSDLTNLVGPYDEKNGTTDSRSVITEFIAGTGVFTVGDNTFNSEVTVTGTDTNFTISDTLTAIESIDITVLPPAPVINSPTNGSPVSGTGEPGATVTVTTESGGTCDATVDVSGNWSCTIVGAINNGDDISAFQFLNPGDLSPTTTVNTGVDTIAPAAAVCTVTPDPANDGTVLTATCTGVETGATVTIPGYTCGAEAGNEVVCTATAGQNGVDGDEVATVTDAAGNFSNADAFFTLDNTAPTIGACTVSPDPANDGTPLTATCTGVETGAVVTIPGYVCGAEAGNEVVCTATAGQNGVDGDEVATATDAAGNTATTPAPFTLDNTAPTAAVCTVTPNPANDGTALSATCTGVETGATVSIPGYTCGAEAGNEVVCTATAGTGPGQVSGDALATTTDAAGNSATSTAAFTLDNTAPTIGACTVTPDPANDGTPLTATCTGVETGAVVTIPGYVCAAEAGNEVVCTATAGQNGVDGDEVATATDAAGNTATTPAPFTLDNTAPTIGACTVTPDPANNGTVVTASCTGVEAGATLTIPGYLCTDNGSGNWSCTGTVGTDGVDGDEVATATDEAGNTATTPAPFVLDNTAPPAPIIITPTNGDPVSGTGEPGAVVTVTTPSGATCTATVQPDGSWSCTLSPTPEDGEDITATQEDEAGNTSPPTTVVGGIDITAPSAPVINPVNENTDPITGSAEPGTTINLTGVTCDNDPIVTNANGDWFCVTSSSLPLTPGDLIVATATDDAGNVSQPASTTVGDSVTQSVAPTVDPVAAGATSITGSAVAGSTISIDGITCSNDPVVADANGDWTCDAPAPIPVTDDIIMVTATQTGLLESPPVSTTVYDPGTTAPPAPQVNPTDGDPVTGTTIPNGDITVLDDAGNVLCTTTADVNGNYSCSPVIPAPADGDVLSVIVTDENGNSSLPTEVTVDISAPATPVVTITEDIDDDGFISAAELSGDIDVVVTIPVDAVVGDTISITDGVTVTDIILTAADITSGSVSTSFTNPGDGNSITINATVTDAAGNTSPAGGDTALIDSSATAAPTVTITEDSNNDGLISSAELSGDIDVLVTIPAGAVAGDTITITDGVTVTPIVLSATDITNGFVNATFAAPAEGSSITINATLTDAAGNTSAAGNDVAVLDTTATAAPTVVISEDVNDDGLISGSELSGDIDVLVTLPAGAAVGDTITITDGVTTTPIVLSAADITSGSVTSSFVSPGEGNSITINATLTDVAGNTSPAGSDAAVIDTSATAAPTVTISEDSNDDGLISNAELSGDIDVLIDIPAGAIAGDTISITDGVTVTPITLTATDIANGTISTTFVSPGDGNSITVSATLTDQAGNVSASGSDSAIIDVTAPTAPVCVVTPDPAMTGETVTALCTGVETDATVTIPGYVCGVETSNEVTCTATAGVDGVDGDEAATVTDLAGNSVDTPATFTIDDEAPAAPTIVSPSNGQIVSGTGEVGATVTVVTDSGATCTATVQPDTTWSCVLSPEPVDGETATATQTDNAGNESGQATAIIAYVPDLSSFITNCVAGVKPNETLIYEVSVMNLGNITINSAQVTTAFGNSLSAPSWICQSLGGASCGNVSGNGDLNEMIDLPAGSGLVYMFETEVTGALLDFIDANATVIMPNGVTDVNGSNNSAFDSDLIYNFIFKDSFDCAAPGTVEETTNLLQSMLQ